MALMAAETLGVDYDDVRPIIGDTSSLGYTFLTGGSRATFSSGMAVVQASEDIIRQACARAAKVWEIDEDAVTWEAGLIKPSGPNAGDFEPMTLADIAKHANKTGGPIAGHAQINAQGAAPSFGVHVVDVEVDPETGKVDILRYTVLQDAGKAVHPAYVEGQFQGGAAQGIGWALNEEYIYNDKGQMENTGFLDYRIPVCSDLPMIETVIVEEPNPRHPMVSVVLAKHRSSRQWRPSQMRSAVQRMSVLANSQCPRQRFWRGSRKRRWRLNSRHSKDN